MLMSKKVNNLEHAEAAPIEELEELKAFWAKNGNTICIVLLLLVAGIYGFRWFKNDQQAKIYSAQAELAAANTIEELSIVIDNNTSSYVTPLAILKIGAAYAAEKRYDDAIFNFNSFIADYPTHPLVENAEISLATAYENKGEIDKALEIYKRLSGIGEGNEGTTSSAKYYKDDAILGLARCQIFKGDKDAAIATLGKIYSSTSVQRGDEIKKAINRLSLPKVEAPASTAEDFFSTPIEDEASTPATK